MLRYLKAVNLADHLLDLVQTRVAELVDLVALLTDEMVVLPVTECPLVARLILAKLVPDDELAGYQEFECIVDRRPRQAFARLLETHEECVGVDVIRRGVDGVEDGEALGRLPLAALFQKRAKPLAGFVYAFGREVRRVRMRLRFESGALGWPRGVGRGRRVHSLRNERQPMGFLRGDASGVDFENSSTTASCAGGGSLNFPRRNVCCMRLLLALALLTLSACSGARPVEQADAAPETTVVLVSIDGFRYDYLNRADVQAPTLRMLASAGVRAERLIPVFPTKTFPNHYSLVTGLYPEQHGVVGNSMRDPAMLDEEGRPMEFSMSNSDANADARWWGGEPIWTTAERQGVRAGTVFWPGSEVDRPNRPTHWMPYDDDLSYSARIDTALAWLDRPQAERPRLIALYFSAVDSEGHDHGPGAPEVAEAISEVDDALARLVAGLDTRGGAGLADLIIVSDHGMVAVDRSRVVVLNDALDLETVDVDWGEPVGIWPNSADDTDAIVAQIDALDHVRAYRKENTPARLRYRDNGRIPPIVLIADDGWTVTSQSYLDGRDDRPSGGSHGFDNAYASMSGLFIAHGPHFGRGMTIDSLSAVDVYGILARALGVDPAPSEADASAVRRVMR